MCVDQVNSDTAYLAAIGERPDKHSEVDVRACEVVTEHVSSAVATGAIEAEGRIEDARPMDLASVFTWWSPIQ